MSRFAYVKYDELARIIQMTLMDRVQAFETALAPLPESRAKSLALTKIEEAYMWCGKAVRDDQIARNGSAESQEQRGNE